jgi:hypothetical protein
MLPIELIKRDPVKSIPGKFVVATQEQSYLTPQGMQFGQARKYYEAKKNDNILTYAETSKNSYPMITISAYGRGKIMYYGLFDEDSDFKADIYYPVFWKRALDVLIGGKTIGELNKDTGYLQTVSKEQAVETPEGKRTGKAITLDYAGFYDFSAFSIAANLISEEEQSLNRDSISEQESNLDAKAKRGMEETKKKDLTFMLIGIIGMLLLFELAYIKFRGDI